MPAPIPLPILTQLDGRDVALWLADDAGTADPASAVALSRLPWSVVISERSDEAYISGLATAEAVDDPLVARRGLVHVVDTDPDDLDLPPRHLAVLLLNGAARARQSGLAARTRRLNMLKELRRRSVRQLVVVAGETFAVPEELTELWEDGFRTVICFVSDDPGAATAIREWRARYPSAITSHVELGAAAFAAALAREYTRTGSAERSVRIRDDKGAIHTVDVSKIDDPERPVLGAYELIGAGALLPLLPDDLRGGDIDSFFADPASSWRPYAAGMAWNRTPGAWAELRSRLGALDRHGVEANRILYVPTEPGAGATTLLRDLAFRSASEGYPTLVSRRNPAEPTSLEMAGLLTRLVTARRDPEDPGRLYEVPCVIVFDQGDWSGRLAELAAFSRDLGRSGRRVCVLVATGPVTGLDVLTDPRFVEIARLSHAIDGEQAFQLGQHLNRFLAPHGTARSPEEWRAFLAATAIEASRGMATFWIALSFWLQRQIDIGETVQARVYRAFRDDVGDPGIRLALLRIAAFSTVREPLPDELLPETEGWPLSDRIEDSRSELGILGLVRVRGEYERYWTLAHGLLGRLLIGGLFADLPMRRTLGFERATSAEHLRFDILREISALPVLQGSAQRRLADEFAVSIFKIDPEHGHGAFVPFWREVLEALDAMPRLARTSSRTFLHHCAISRRRIASDPVGFALSSDERARLLERAVEDIQAALRIDPASGGETEINLYNSLAHALHDLGEAQEAAGCDAVTVGATRYAAGEATREAYSRNPDNSFVVETYGRELLSQGTADGSVAAERALEVLALVYGLRDRPGSEYRSNALARLAERAFGLLMSAGGTSGVDTDTAPGAIGAAIAKLGAGVSKVHTLSLEALPAPNRAAAAALLSTPILADNVQAVKLRYLLACIDQPMDFTGQLELLQSLSGSGPAFTPQMRLEMAVLMFQTDRAPEAEVLFRELRATWRRGQHFVEVPARLHWLLDGARADRRQVRAHVSSNSDGRSFAKITDLRGISAPFRAAEFGTASLRPGAALAGFVSFGHNGPLLRPLTATWR